MTRDRVVNVKGSGLLERGLKENRSRMRAFNNVNGRRKRINLTFKILSSVDE